MKTGNCRCGNRIFFNNHCCLACDATLGRCGSCRALTSFSDINSVESCDSCGAVVYPCANMVHGVCRSFNQVPEELCRLCEFTQTTPTLSDAASVARWSAMESAKRRLLVQLEELGLPPFIGNLNETRPLRFEFLEDAIDESGQTSGVTTGHEEGLITINLAEADSVHRERVRVQMREPQRTLIGHMRHEAGHYIDWSWASRLAAMDYHRLFGDPSAADYARAMDWHYNHGPPSDWALNHVSAYATMHPCEDFAETVNVYLDIMAIATTASDIGARALNMSPSADPQQLVSDVLDIVIEVSEYNFDLGLSALLPESLPPAVIEKLAYVHSLRSLNLEHVDLKTQQSGLRQHPPLS